MLEKEPQHFDKPLSWTKLFLLGMERQLKGLANIARELAQSLGSHLIVSVTNDFNERKVEEELQREDLYVRQFKDVPEDHTVVQMRSHISEGRSGMAGD